MNEDGSSRGTEKMHQDGNQANEQMNQLDAVELGSQSKLAKIWIAIIRGALSDKF